MKNLMLRNYYINREWILSPAAQTIYRVSATLSLVLVFILMPLHRRIDDMSQSLLPLVRIVVFTCVLGAAITMVAMEYFLFGFDTPSSFKKLFWFGVMLFPPLGPPLYCFIMYSRSNVLQKSGDQRERGLR